MSFAQRYWEIHDLEISLIIISIAVLIMIILVFIFRTEMSPLSKNKNLILMLLFGYWVLKSIIFGIIVFFRAMRCGWK